MMIKRKSCWLSMARMLLLGLRQRLKSGFASPAVYSSPRWPMELIPRNWSASLLVAAVRTFYSARTEGQRKEATRSNVKEEYVTAECVPALTRGRIHIFRFRSQISDLRSEI